jgi:hypothetical protein
MERTIPMTVSRTQRLALEVAADALEEFVNEPRRGVTLREQAAIRELRNMALAWKMTSAHIDTEPVRVAAQDFRQILDSYRPVEV